jgi:hypothetical protein
MAERRIIINLFLIGLPFSLLYKQAYCVFGRVITKSWINEREMHLVNDTVSC